MSEREINRLLSAALSPEGRLSVAKVFTAADVVVAVGPARYGRPVEDLTRVVHRVLSVPECVPLLGVRGARERTYAIAAVLATEAAVADLVARGTGVTGAAVVSPEVVETSIARPESVLGRPLTSGQAKAVWGICGEGRRVSLVLGVAGAGKTTAIRCAAEAYAAAGYEVVGTATSGQAARTLGRDAGLADSRTVASLLWRLDRGTLQLTSRHVVVLDEAGMTDDGDMLRLLTAWLILRRRRARCVNEPPIPASPNPSVSLAHVGRTAQELLGFAVQGDETFRHPAHVVERPTEDLAWRSPPPEWSSAGGTSSA